MVASLHDLRILIVADDALARAGLATLLRDQPGCAIAGQIASQSDLAAEAGLGQPDVVLWDFGWNPTLGLERLGELAEGLPPVLALLPADTRGEGMAGQAWRAGARGLLLRDADFQRLLAALQALGRGLVVLDPSLAGDLLISAQPGSAVDGAVEALTARELEVLHLLAEGLPNKTIAQRLGVSEHTIKFHVNAILGKLGAQSRTEAVVRATRLGLILL
jgi:DNA-binding NarL/FixJ family response regulator